MPSVTSLDTSCLNPSTASVPLIDILIKVREFDLTEMKFERFRLATEDILTPVASALSAYALS
jgi:hypothetical protein